MYRKIITTIVFLLATSVFVIAADKPAGDAKNPVDEKFKSQKNPAGAN